MSLNVRPPSDPSVMLLSKWPPQDLETLNQCPVCKSPSRTLLYSDLEDWSFRAAPGLWSLWTCNHCGTSYLDPRPTPASIGRAYASYYTHAADSRGDEAAPPANHHRASRGILKTALRNGYLSYRFGHQLKPRLSMGALLFRLPPTRMLKVDVDVRHLPPPKQAGARFLDVGCGDGSFLLEAQSLGYQATGVDPDPKAVAHARKRGLDAHVGGFPSLNFPSGAFEQITLSQVIEHLHDPVGALSEIYRLLKHNGRIWLSTPNMNSLTLEEFGKHWRGLESPRHLALFTHDSVKSILSLAGFEEISFHPYRPCAGFFVAQSLAQQQNTLPSGQEPSQLTKRWRDRISHIDKVVGKEPRRSDVVVATAVRP